MEAKRRELIKQRGQGQANSAAPSRLPLGGLRPSAAAKGPPARSAARSHEMNDVYMNKMEDALLAMGRTNTSGEVRPSKADGQCVPNRDSNRRKSCDESPECQIEMGSYRYYGPTNISEKFATGPAELKGQRLDMSDRNITCMSVNEQKVVVGSCDHALYEFNMHTGSRAPRKLYTKNYGHKEWITTVAHFPDGRVVSGAMDSKVCVWDARALKCVDLIGHGGSISVVLAGRDGRTVLSSSYDKTIRFWDVGRSKPTGVSILQGHKAPVLGLVWSEDGIVASGDRAGAVRIWDATVGHSLWSVENAHEGHVTALAWLPSGAGSNTTALLMSGGQDGQLRVWDHRQKRKTAEQPLHCSTGGSGAIGQIEYVPQTRTVVTAGADKRINVVDIRMGFTCRCSYEDHHDFIYSLAVCGRYAFSGAGDGQILAHDIEDDKLLYGLKSFTSAVRCIGVTNEQLIAGGDDGKVIVWAMG
uniref:Guanine nucleotide-binding protein subunit beta-like protein n=1 Tax=Pyramimonas obovata TaxID=1411642 RepID=A0A7S0N463_9CHLO|mmetsp:Transcript_19855/g.43438  ORF Transcript_19855/g.43438 Transcript_19855/m.43438 type:complete len:472 (+) Transcript_19855:197-1612(+)|eukprot:CAMPEP_0118954716 /NCGR_PEP_ID=MMETSP1169-20130426/58750_1 /TAXON_ID=36882 /ORGANISM="Pyramimonas obovata, Strain CCMP722" /LENGTH=471 /DNA_ID=CAMNT_0006902397 /DNA_START=122 /DNA_END=1537 /DNA_ORIENTATION=-